MIVKLADAYATGTVNRSCDFAPDDFACHGFLTEFSYYVALEPRIIDEVPRRHHPLGPRFPFKRKVVWFFLKIMGSPLRAMGLLMVPGSRVNICGIRDIGCSP